MRWLLLGFASALWGQVLLVDGDGAFIALPRATVQLQAQLVAASIGGGVGGVNVRFIAPVGRGSFGGTQTVTVRTDAMGRAVATLQVGEQTGWFGVDAVAELGDGAVATWAVTVGAGLPGVGAETMRNLRAETRRLLLRNAADGSNQQLIGPFLVRQGTWIRPSRWGKSKESGGLWRAEEDSWFFWVDDAPAKTWSKPSRYYLFPVGGSPTTARLGGEMWWPMARVGTEGIWQSLGRATASFGEAFQGTPGANAGTRCTVVLSANGAPGVSVTVAAFLNYAQRQGFTRFLYRLPIPATCESSLVLLTAMGDRDGVWLGIWKRYEDLAAELATAANTTVIVEAPQSGNAVSWWQGRGWGAAVVSAADTERLTYMQELRGGFVVKGLLPALERQGGNFNLAVAELRSSPDVTVAAARPQFARVEAVAVRRFAVPDFEFSNLGGVGLAPLTEPTQRTTLITANLANESVGRADLVEPGVYLQGLREGLTEYRFSLTDGRVRREGVGALRVGLGVSSVKTCLQVVGGPQCQGTIQRAFPVGEDEAGGHVVFETQDSTVAVVDARLYTYNRGERTVPYSVRAIAAGRTTMRARSHDGQVLLDVPIEVRDAPAPLLTPPPRACPDAATYRVTFTPGAGEPALYDAIGGNWWGNGISVIFRRPTPTTFEMRSSGAPEGQFFAMGGTVAADCSFVGSGQGVAAQRITTAQVRGRIAATAGTFDRIEMDYTIGVDNVLPNMGRAAYTGSGSAVSGCGFQLEPADAGPQPFGGFFAVNVRSAPLCPWSATVDGGPRIVANAEGFGSGVIWLEAGRNSNAAPRFATVRAGGASLRLSQPGVSPAGPVVTAVWSAGKLSSITGLDSLLIVVGERLGNGFRVGGRIAPVLASIGGVAYVGVPTGMAAGTHDVVAFVGTAQSNPVRISLEQVAPAALGWEGGAIIATGLDPSLPLVAEVEGAEARVAAVSRIGLGLYRVTVEGIFRANARVLLRQGGRSSD